MQYNITAQTTASGVTITLTQHLSITKDCFMSRKTGKTEKLSLNQHSPSYLYTCITANT